jgi:hypothetical protein
MFIGRPFILAHRQVWVGVHSKETNAAPEPTEIPRTKAPDSHVQWDFLVQDCVKAANEVISICHVLQTGVMGLAKSSYAEYSSCRAALLVLIAYSICYRTNEFSSTLQKGLDAIREMASVGDSARSEVCLLETLEAALHRLHVFDPTPHRPTITGPKSSAQEGYEGFLNWYTQLGVPTNSCAVLSTCNGDDAQRAKAQNRNPSPQGRSNRSDPAMTSMQNDPFVDDYPFDFDLLNSVGTVAFFTPDFNEQGNPERDLFVNLL